MVGTCVFLCYRDLRSRTIQFLYIFKPQLKRAKGTWIELLVRMTIASFTFGLQLVQIRMHHKHPLMSAYRKSPSLITARNSLKVIDSRFCYKSTRSTSVFFLLTVYYPIFDLLHSFPSPKFFPQLPRCGTPLPNPMNTLPSPAHGSRR